MLDNKQSQIQAMLLAVVRSMVDSPEEVGVELISDDEGPVFHIAANQADLGRLIGKGGQTARALEVLVNAGAATRSHRFQIEIDRTAHA